MRVFRWVGVTGLVLALSVACGKSEEQRAAEKAAEETKEAADALKKAAESAGAAGAAQGLQEFAKAMESAAAAMGGTKDGKPVEPVSFQSLQAALPEVSGWQRAEPTGERMTAPVAYSQTDVDYTMGDASVNMKIVDSAFSQLLIAPWTMFLTAGYEEQTSDGYEKSINVGGNPGFEKWSMSGKSGELNLVVAKRFLVTIEGNNINDTKVLHDFAAKVDGGKLAAAR
jgi:HPt (histidine-containing phosphotransfer) domain-containing protein